MTMAATPLEPMPYSHVTVMPVEVVHALAPHASGLYLDVTAGGGGHSAALLEASGAARVVAFDRDPAAIAAARERLAPYGDRARVVRATFDQIGPWLQENGGILGDGLVADLGVSSAQLDDPDRGMSFRSAGPIDMRMDPSSGETALELIARATQDQLADVIYQFGEERRSRRVARCVKQALEEGQLVTTQDLRRAVVRAVGPRRVGGVDPATRTFQALRIAVNEELAQLSRLLEGLPRLLAPSGVAAIISFHSLEDRLVKRAFRVTDVWERLHNKPLIASELERANNPRARSAKLRTARRAVSEGSA